MTTSSTDNRVLRESFYVKVIQTSSHELKCRVRKLIFKALEIYSECLSSLLHFFFFLWCSLICCPFHAFYGIYFHVFIYIINGCKPNSLYCEETIINLDLAQKTSREAWLLYILQYTLLNCIKCRGNSPKRRITVSKPGTVSTFCI